MRYTKNILNKLDDDHALEVLSRASAMAMPDNEHKHEEDMQDTEYKQEDTKKAKTRKTKENIDNSSAKKQRKLTERMHGEGVQ